MMSAAVALCEPGLFYDPTVLNCLPCANICGRNGLNKVECQNKCPGFADYVTPSTTVASLALTPVPVKSIDIWVTLAVFSVLLAAVTVIVVMIIIVKSRKLLHPDQSNQDLLESNQGLLPCHAEDGLLPDNTIETLIQQTLSDSPQPMTSNIVSLNPKLPSKHCSYPNILSSHSYLVNLSEMTSQIPRSQTQIFDERDDQRALSPISLKSDLSLAGHAIKADIPEVRAFPGNSLTSVCSSIYSLFHMFGWLNKTCWVMEYSEGASGLRIGVEGIAKTMAEDKIRRKGQHLANFRFVVTTTPTRGRFVPCPNSNRHSTIHQSLTTTLKPGSIIFSDAMEMDPVSRKSEPGYATYSGAVSGLCGGADVGLTVGHLYDNVNQRFFVENRMEGGWCLQKYTSVTHSSLGQVTADLALLHMAVPADNTVTIDGRRYRLSLFKADLSPKLPVIVLLKDGSSSEGIIAESMCTLKKDDLYNTLRIIRAEGKPEKIAGEGYSGALVLSRPVPELSDQLFVYGMVIGYWESDEKDRSHTVATRLWNILETVSNLEHGVEFSCRNEFQMDSGYQSSHQDRSFIHGPL